MCREHWFYEGTLLGSFFRLGDGPFGAKCALLLQGVFQADIKSSCEKVMLCTPVLHRAGWVDRGHNKPVLSRCLVGFPLPSNKNYVAPLPFTVLWPEISMAPVQLQGRLDLWRYMASLVSCQLSLPHWFGRSSLLVLTWPYKHVPWDWILISSSGSQY